MKETVWLCGQESLSFYVLSQKLSPEQYFQESKFIPRSHARQYENELKKEFKSWADEKELEKVKL